MPRRRPPHLQREITRHGKAVWYVRVDRGPPVRIKADLGTPEFDAEYSAALAGTPIRKASPSTSSLQWLLTRYRETTAWSALSSATRKQRDNIFVQVIETAGHEPYARITTATIEAGKERRAHTPAQARNFLDAMRGLFRWAYGAKLVKIDPTVAWPIQSATQHTDSSLGRKIMSPGIKRAGLSALGKGYGSTFCSTPAFAGAMQSVSVARMSATVLPP